MNDAASLNDLCPGSERKSKYRIRSVLNQLNSYLNSCHLAQEKRGDTFPNLAGFCRYLGCGISEFERLQTAKPELYDQICAILEDEALNAEISPSILNAYLKKRLGYTEKAEIGTETSCGEIRLVFEHDISEDGS